MHNDEWHVIGHFLRPADLQQLANTSRDFRQTFPISVVVQYQQYYSTTEMFPYPQLFIPFYSGGEIDVVFVNAFVREAMLQNIQYKSSLQHLLRTTTIMSNLTELCESIWIAKSGCMAAMLGNVKYQKINEWLEKIAANILSYALITDVLPHSEDIDWSTVSTRFKYNYNSFLIRTNDPDYIERNIVDIDTLYDERQRVYMLTNASYNKVVPSKLAPIYFAARAGISDATWFASLTDNNKHRRGIFQYRPWLLYPYKFPLTAEQISPIAYPEYLPDLSLVKKEDINYIITTTPLLEVVEYFYSRLPRDEQYQIPCQIFSN
jgi:hypothetical protein